MDLEKIKALVELLHGSRLTALELSEDGESLRLERHLHGSVAPAQDLPASQAASVVGAGASASASNAPQPGKSAPVAGPVSAPVAAVQIVKASMQGILHLTPAPSEPAFVTVGDHVQAGQVVCVIEAMKMFNTIETEVAGRVVAILAEAGSEVKLGQPLLQIE